MDSTCGAVGMRRGNCVGEGEGALGYVCAERVGACELSRISGHLKQEETCVKGVKRDVMEDLWTSGIKYTAPEERCSGSPSTSVRSWL